MLLPSSLLALLLVLHPGNQPPDGFALLRSGKTAEAAAAFQARLKANTRDADAWLGTGLAALAQGRLGEAREAFHRCLALAPDYADAEAGLAQVLVKEGRAEEAATLLRRLVAAHPERPDLRDQLVALTGLPPAHEHPVKARPARPEVPARVQGRRLEVAGPGGTWQPFFAKGINLGAALPGRYPAEFPDRATYDGWLKEMAELGVNTLRVYTVHPPWFYEALRDFNRRSPRPLWLIHGVWAELPPGHDFFNRAWREGWRKDMEEVVAVLHGQARLPRRPGRSSGAYTADVSRWTLGIILGREWEASSVVIHNRLHPGTTDWRGRFVALRGGHAMERFLAESMDEFLALEWDRFHAQRPMAFTNWPTLDPLHHPTESTEREEAAHRRRLGLPFLVSEEEPNDEDAVGLDLEKFSATPALQAGLFASYHAYPYYPDFINLDPGYAQARDAAGPNNYAGYLADLVKHHARHPVMISEFGVPSSRMVAHWQPQGMTHGGQNEVEQGAQNARLLGNIHESGCAGAILFAWMDEWFKKNWLTLPFQAPLDRKPLWFNEMDAEQNYGLIAYRPGAPGPAIQVDGRDGDWRGVPATLEGGGFTLKLRADEGWLHLGLYAPPSFRLGAQALVVGLDTVDPARGDHQLPWGLDLRSEAGLEFVLLFQGEGRTGVFVDAPYALPDHRFDPRHRYRSVANEAGRFIMAQARSNNDRIGRDGTRFPGHSTEVGWLRRGTQDRQDPAFDARAEWQEGRSSDGRFFLEARIPWTLLHVTDPSTRRVVDDPEQKVPGPVGTALTPGFHACLLSVAAPGPLWEAQGRVEAALPAPVRGRLPRSPRFAWPTWEQPTFHRFRKQSFPLYQKALAATPDAPRPLP